MAAVVPAGGIDSPPTPLEPERERRWPPVVVALVVAMALFAGIGGIIVRLPPPPGPGILPGQVPIRHVVIVMMENRAFDNLFGVYCPATGPTCPTAVDGIPPGTCVPENPANLSVGCIRPFPEPNDTISTPDPPHEWNSSNGAIDGGAMDGFYVSERSGTVPFGFYNSTTVPVYYDLAQEYALGQRFFSSALSYSLPNHWYLLAGQAPPVSVNVSTLGTPYERSDYLNQANATRTVQDLLNATPSVSWKYYDWALPNYTVAISGKVGVVEGSAFNYWSPMAARAESYTGWYDSHFVPRDEFFTDAGAGGLPNVSYVIPAVQFSDHAPATVANGQEFVASIVDAVEASPDWNSTAIFLAWDDYGGFYDHVAPPRIDGLGLSFRVPLLVISPYTPRGLVVSSVGYFESLLHFVEWRFGLGCLTPRDCGAPLPLDYFDFHMAPRAPLLFPTNPANATYPMLAASVAGTMGSPGLAGSGCGTHCVVPGAWDTGPPEPNATEDDLD